MSMIERMLNEEIRDKKRTGNGIHSKTGSRGYVGKMMFPSDLMKGKQKRNYVRSSEVMSWNTKEILPKEQFDTFDQEQQKEMLTAWRTNFTNEQIMKQMKLGQYGYYKLLDVLSIKKDSYKQTKRKSVAITSAPKIVELVEKKPTIEKTTAPVFTEGLNLNVNGTYNSDTLITWLTKLQMLVEGDGEYDVVIHLREKK